MNEIQFVSNHYKPNIRIVKKYIITFDKNLIILYNLKGNRLDDINLVDYNLKIYDICIINDNYLIAFATKNEINGFYFYFHFIKYYYLSISINNLCFTINSIKSIESRVNCFSYLKNINILILSFGNNIKIFEINSLNLVNIQTISGGSNFINFDKNSFIAYKNHYISIYKKIPGVKYYQLISKLKFQKYKNNTKNTKLLKLDNINILIYTKNNLYIINLKKMKIIQEYIYTALKRSKTGLIYKKKNKIFIYQNNLHIFEYSDFSKQLSFIKSIHIESNIFVNHLVYLLIEKKLPLLKNKIKFKQTDSLKNMLLLKFESYMNVSYMKESDIRILFYLMYKPMKEIELNELYIKILNELPMAKLNQNISDKKLYKELKLKKYQKYNYKRNKIKKNQKIFPSNKFKKNYR